jgi:hypothetical protein
MYSAGFYGIVPEWNINTRAGSQRSCASTPTQASVNGVNFQCLTAPDGYFQSAIYSFNGKKVRAVASEVAGAKKCQRVDTFELETGEKYDITSLQDHQIVDLMVLSRNRTAIPDIVKSFGLIQKIV